MSRKIFGLVIVLFVFTLCVPILGQAVPEDVAGKLMIKVISFNKNLARMGNPIKVGVTDDKMLKAMEALKGIAINGIPFTVARIGGPAEVGKFSVVYVGPGAEAQVEKYAAAAKAAKVLIFAGSRAGVERGAAVGFFVDAGKPKIAVAPAHAEAQGGDFAENFLKVSMVIGEVK